jgi:hypothetical protein
MILDAPTSADSPAIPPAPSQPIIYLAVYLYPILSGLISHDGHPYSGDREVGAVRREAHPPAQCRCVTPAPRAHVPLRSSRAAARTCRPSPRRSSALRCGRGLQRVPHAAERRARGPRRARVRGRSVRACRAQPRGSAPTRRPSFPHSPAAAAAASATALRQGHACPLASACSRAGGAFEGPPKATPKRPADAHPRRAEGPLKGGPRAR